MDDLISRSALLKQIEGRYTEIDWVVSRYNANGIYAWIEAAPAVDAVEVVHGRWESANDGTHFCPHCGCDAPYTWDDIDRNFINSADDVPDRPSNYCPNCGADMRERKENG